MVQFVSNLKIKIITLFLIINLFGFAYSCYSEQLLNQDVDVSSGSTVSHSTQVIQQLTGGPYTIDNEGTIEASNITSHAEAILLEVGTSVDNSGLITTNGSANINGINFENNSETNSVTNSGTIQSNTTGNYGGGIIINESSVSEIVNTSTGTIRVIDSLVNSAPIRVNAGGIVNKIENNGTISATGSKHSRGIISINTGIINQLVNTGTISAQGGSNSNHGIAIWNNSGTNLTNSGSISGTGGNYSYGIRVGSEGNISSITNSGTITGGTHGIANSNNITNIINTGTITGSAGYGIHNNEGNITNLTNSQNNLTLLGNLPTNYYIKVNSTTSYGKITITNPNGSMNVGVTDDSTLSVGTYSAVINGLSAENISNSSGTFIDNNNHYKYSINNSTGTQWDLIIDDLTSDTQCSVDSNKPGCSKAKCITTSIETTLNTLANGNFAHMNTYDCNTFGRDGNCISIGGRYISINDPKSETSGIVLVYGKKHSQNFRWGGFIHYNINYNTSSNLTLSDKVPLIGFYGVWNENEDKSGLQFKIGNSYQAINATIIRPQAGASEKAKGETKITANKFILELRDNIFLSDITTVSPYLAMRYSEKYQKGYTEKNVDLPLTFNKIFDNSWSVIGGLKYNFKISQKYRFDGTFGVDHDISHNVSKLSPNGVSGITSVDLTKNHRSTRYIVSFGLDNMITKNQVLRLKVQYEELPYQGMNESNMYATYNFLF